MAGAGVKEINAGRGSGRMTCKQHYPGTDDGTGNGKRITGELSRCRPGNPGWLSPMGKPEQGGRETEMKDGRSVTTYLRAGGFFILVLCAIHLAAAAPAEASGESSRRVSLATGYLYTVALKSDGTLC